MAPVAAPAKELNPVTDPEFAALLEGESYPPVSSLSKKPIRHIEIFPPVAAAIKPGPSLLFLPEL